MFTTRAKIPANKRLLCIVLLKAEATHLLEQPIKNGQLQVVYYKRRIEKFKKSKF